MTGSNECVFCQIIKGKLPTKKVWESDEILAIKDINPQAPVHVLLMPKQHFESIAKAEDKHGKILGKLMLAARDVARQLKVENAFQLKIFSGRDAGQTVFHLHVHLQAGWKKKQAH